MKKVLKTPDLMMDVKRRNVKKFGHVIRLKTTRVITRVFKINPKDRKKVDMSRLRWLERTQNGLLSLKLKRCK
jgi:hypothetical protein